MRCELVNDSKPNLEFRLCPEQLNLHETQNSRQHMGTMNPNYYNFVLSIFPVKVTVGQLKSWIAQNDEASKKSIIDFIYHRLNHRYIKPLMHIPEKYKSGFLMMASACLMIETLQSFYSGKMSTKGASAKAFEAFFERGKNFFPGLAAESINFFVHIRCGILHQAETTGGYRIWRVGSLFNKKEKIINANEFVKALERCLDHYISNLRASESNSPLWKNAVKKVGFICDNCQR